MCSRYSINSIRVLKSYVLSIKTNSESNNDYCIAEKFLSRSTRQGENYLERIHKRTSNDFERGTLRVVVHSVCYFR